MIQINYRVLITKEPQMTGPRDEFTPYWLQTAMPFGTTPVPPWLSVRIPRPPPDYLELAVLGAGTGEQTDENPHT